MRLPIAGLLGLGAAGVVAATTSDWLASTLTIVLVSIAGLAMVLGRQHITLVAIWAAALSAAGWPMPLLDWRIWAYAVALTFAADGVLPHGRDSAAAWRTTGLLALGAVSLFGAARLYRPSYASLFAPDAVGASTLFVAALGTVFALLVTAGPATARPPDATKAGQPSQPRD